MQEISIITNDDTEYLKNRLLSTIKSEIGNELSVNINDSLNILSLKVRDDKIKQLVTNAIAKTIIESYEKKMLYKVINSNYYYFKMPEKREILKHSLNYIASEHNHMMGKLLAKRRFNIVSKQIDEFLKTEQKLNLDGFVNFRLKDYISELEEIVDKAVDDFMVEKEYNEFIKLLKYFVDMQPAKYDAIHIVVNNKKKYRIFDTSKKEITAKCINDITKNIEESLNEDDMIISALIALSPKKIYIHHAELIENKEMANTIEKVFTEKISKCNGCEFCNRIE